MQTFISAVGIQRPGGVAGVAQRMSPDADAGTTSQSVYKQRSTQPQQESCPVHGDTEASHPDTQAKPGEPHPQTHFVPTAWQTPPGPV